MPAKPQFMAFEEVSSVPHIIVDGPATTNTEIVLSHWPKSGTPVELKRDTSAEIAFAYLDTPEFHVPHEAVSNNHFDEDGLIGLFTLIDPRLAEKHRDLLIAVATAGDFGVCTRRDAARIAFVLSACADAETSPLVKHVFELSYSAYSARLYVELLELLPRLFDHLDDYRSLWEPEDARFAASEQLFVSGAITLEELPELDLAIVRMPDDLDLQRMHRFTQARFAECHPFAIHNRTQCSRILSLWSDRAEFQYRYESWVQLVSRKPLPRVDLSPFAEELNLEETAESRWHFDGVDAITPKLYLRGNSPTSIPPESIRSRLVEYLRGGSPAWDPYD